MRAEERAQHGPKRNWSTIVATAQCSFIELRSGIQQAAMGEMKQTVSTACSSSGANKTWPCVISCATVLPSAVRRPACTSCRVKGRCTSSVE